MTFETFLMSDRGDPRATRATSYALGLAVALHAAALIAAVVQSQWRVDELSPPPIPITMLTLPPAPAPPPAAGQPATQRVRQRTSARVQPRPERVIQPAQPAIPNTSEPSQEPTTDGPPGDPDGVPGSPCTVDCTGHAPVRFVGPTVASGQLAINPQAAAHRATLPPALARTGMRLWALVRLCMDRQGAVQSVDILRGADPAADPLIVAALRTWRYRPYAIDGRPVPFCTNVRYEIGVN